MCAEIIAVGPYSESVGHFMEYPEQHYASTLAGSIITRRLFGIIEGSTLSREFAFLLGVTDPWDFSQHRLSHTLFDTVGLMEFGRRYPDYLQDVESLIGLMSAGFEFHFRPEG